MAAAQVKALVLATAFVLASATGCGDADAHRAKLTGIWERDIELEDAKGHTTLVLETKGRFTERVQLSGANRPLDTIQYEGQWLTDGSSFTLRYLRENGHQYGGGAVRFLTLQLSSVTPEEFVGHDELGSRDFVYRRVGKVQP